MPDKSLNERIDKYVTELVANRPPLTEAERRKIAAILRPTTARSR